MGRAKASPTMVTVVTRLASIALSAWFGSKLVLGRVTQVPPIAIAPIAESRPVPCIMGGSGRFTGPGWDWIRLSSSSKLALGGIDRRGLPPAPMTLNKSSCCHITPFGMPVVPPVYKNKRSSGECATSTALPSPERARRSYRYPKPRYERCCLALQSIGLRVGVGP